jgi:hypothetical protein
MFDRHVVNSINSIFSNAAKSFHAVQSHIEPAEPAEHEFAHYGDGWELTSDGTNCFADHPYEDFQECAEVALLRSSPRHTRSILMDSTH